LLLTRPDLPTENAAEIVGQLAHELRQPLSAMEAIVYYLQLTVVDDARTRAQIEKLRQLIEQSGSILSDAVHYLQAAPARPEPHDLHEALAESAGRLATLDQNLLAFDLADPFPLLNFDLIQMQHLLGAALRFCLRASRRAHPVEVVTRVVLRFATTAPHLDLLSPDDLFTPFEDHPAAVAGLGLASVRRIAEAHGGDCRLLTEPGHRLALRIELPL
jgi:signal transduction histidine kinase